MGPHFLQTSPPRTSSLARIWVYAERIPGQWWGGGAHNGGFGFGVDGMVGGADDEV